MGERLAGLYQGTVTREASDGRLHVQMHQTEILVVNVGDSTHVEKRLVLKNKLGVVHVCDGSRFLKPMLEEGKPCGCPDDFFERRAAARTGVGPRPDVSIVFRLAAAPEIGDLQFTSSAWQLFESLESVSSAMAQSDGAVQMVLSLRERRLETRSGVDVSFTYPEVRSVQRLPAATSDLHLAA
ncbi:hypothetical protein ABZ137_03940 [Streptomyces bobili]